MMSAPKLFLSLTACAVLLLSACFGVEDDYQLEDESYSSVVAPGDEEPAPTELEPICPAPVDGEPVDDTLCLANGYCCDTTTLTVSKTTKAGCTNGTWQKDILDCLDNSRCGDSCRIN